MAAGALLEYVQDTQKSDLGHITRLEPYHRGRNLIIDEATRRSLELTRTMREGRREGSLLAVLDQTVTPMGARLLSDWLSNPLTDLGSNQCPFGCRRRTRRRCALAQGTSRAARTDVRFAAADRADRHRPGQPSRFGVPGENLGPTSPAESQAQWPAVGFPLRSGNRSWISVPKSARRLNRPSSRNRRLLTTDGGIIREGFHAQLDELRDLARGGKQWIANYQAQEIERTGIPNLKIGFNKVFGYYLEVTATHAAKVPEDYLRKQTLKNQERYITPELKEHEDKVLRAEESATSLEQELFQTLREQVAARMPKAPADGRGLGPD